MEACDFLDKLPLEIRLRIYEFHLTFRSPIKIRYILPGTKDLPLLRLNRQIHHEALQVLYERNRVVVKWAYFCKSTSPASKSPIQVDWIRHLLIDGIGSSVMCVSPESGMHGCNVCRQLDPGEVVKSLKAFPRLKTVVLNYHEHRTEMKRFMDKVEASDNFESVPVDGDSDPFAFRIQGPELGKIIFEFRNSTSGWVDRAVQDQIDWLQRL